MILTGVDVPWREGDLPSSTAVVGDRADGDRIAVATAGRGRRRAAAAAARGRARRPRREGAARRRRRRHDDRRVPDRARPRRPTSSTTSPPSTASSSCRTPEPPDEETAALVRRAAATLRLREPLARAGPERGSEHLYREIELPLARVLAAMEDTGVKIDTYRMGEITARLADRVEELEAQAYELAGEEFMIGSTAAGRADPVREARADAGPQGQDGLLDRHARPAHDPRRARDRAGDRGVARVLEAPQHLPRPLPTLIGDGRPAAHDDQPDRRRDRPPLDDEPEPAVDPDPHRSSAARSARPSSPRRASG